jgi:uncharacterized protein (DUF111 family)
MRVAYFDCSGGISGVATLAALVDAGADLERVSAGLGFLSDGFPIISTESRLHGAFRVRSVSIDGGETPVGARLEDIEALLSKSEMPDRSRALVLRVYDRLARAEARVHGADPETVSFHEIGSRRSIAGVVGSVLALEQLGIAKVVSTPVPIGHGTVETAHGRLELPTPATLELLRGVPVEAQHGPGELVTPTGAAILVAAASSFGAIPAMTIEDIGYGTGDGPHPKAVLRVVLGEATDAGDVQRL